MRLVTTMMTTKEMPDICSKGDADHSRNLTIRQRHLNHNFGDRRYFEADIDLLGVEFTKETLYDGIKQLISAYEEIMNTKPMQIDFIAANDDTESEIARYAEKT
jgi:homogentisate 1,2-dioxygenase